MDTRAHVGSLDMRSMSSVSTMAEPKSKKGEQMSQEKIIATFQRLRAEQRAIASKMSELDGEKSEHRTVISALKEVSPDRRCYRMVGGVLVERQVKDVLPALEHNYSQLTSIIDKLTEQLASKGKELNVFKEKHNISLGEESSKDSTSTTPDSVKTSGSMLVT